MIKEWLSGIWSGLVPREAADAAPPRRELPPRSPEIQAMWDAVVKDEFDGYYLGEMILVGVERDNTGLCLHLNYIQYRFAEAHYIGCAFSQLTERSVGTSIHLVRRVDAGELKSSYALMNLAGELEDCEKALQCVQKWEERGLHFYLHYGTQRNEEYLIVCKSLRYKDDFVDTIKNGKKRLEKYKKSDTRRKNDEAEMETNTIRCSVHRHVIQHDGHERGIRGGGSAARCDRPV